MVVGNCNLALFDVSRMFVRYWRLLQISIMQWYPTKHRGHSVSCPSDLNSAWHISYIFAHFIGQNESFKAQLDHRARISFLSQVFVFLEAVRNSSEGPLPVTKTNSTRVTKWYKMASRNDQIQRDLIAGVQHFRAVAQNKGEKKRRTG